MASYAEIKAKLQQEGKKIRKRLSYDEHNLQAAEVRYIRGVYPDLEGVFFAVPNGGKYIIVRSIDEFIQAIDNYLNGEL